MLWVKETWTQDERGGTEPNGEAAVYYRADMPDTSVWRGYWKPSIHMSRWASRYLLEITNVRVERLTQMSEEDAIAEGVSHDAGLAPLGAFAKLWDHLNAKRGFSWQGNPWVWVLEFRRV